MKAKILILFLTAVLVKNILGFGSERQLAYVTRIKYSTPGKKAPSIPCLYHGSAVMCKNGFCRLPEAELRTFFSLIITPRVEFVSHRSTRSMKRIKGSPCKWYNLSLRFTDSAKDKKKFYEWTIEEVDASKRPLRLPDHASLIIELDPTFIEKLEPPSSTGPNAIKLPSVILKDSVTEEEIEKALVTIAAQAPDRNINCTKPMDIVKKQGNILLKKQVQ